MRLQNVCFGFEKVGKSTCILLLEVYGNLVYNSPTGVNLPRSKEINKLTNKISDGEIDKKLTA